MADGRFFKNVGPFSANQLAEISGAKPGGKFDGNALYKDVQPLDIATNSDVSFLDNKKYKVSFGQSNAGICIIRPEMEEAAPDTMALLLTSDPYTAYARVATAFYPGIIPKPGISTDAYVHETAEVGDNCHIQAGVHVGAHAKIGDNTILYANSVVADGCEIGTNCSIGANASLQCCLIGNDVILHPGVRIGQDGFGFAPGAQGHLKVPQLGRVVIGNHVEIGANTSIDRGTGPDTVIGDGTKIDNLVQIGHNVEIGQHCFIVSQVGISGSTKIGNFTMLGGQVGVAGHLTLGSGVKVAAQSGIMRDVADGQTVGGSPAQPMKAWMREIATLQKLAKKKVG